MRSLLTALVLLLLLPNLAAAQRDFTLQGITDGVYAAVARRGTDASTNALIVVGKDYAVVAGAHLTKGAIRALVSATRAVTTKPIRYFILTHHHQGYSQIDFDFPPGCDVLMSWQTWRVLGTESRSIDFPVLFYKDGLTLKLGNRTVILTNLGPAHSASDTIVYLPDSGTLFASDLLYVHSVGYMGEAHLQNWVLALQFMQGLNARTVVPGYGPVGTDQELTDFKDYLQDFLTAVLGHLEKGESLKRTLATFKLPAYRDYDGYREFMPGNIRRAYKELKENVVN